MSQQPFFCSELSRNASEKTFGTASVGEVWLLVEYTLAWRPRALDESVLSPKIKRHVSRLLKSIPRSRVLFIKQGRDCGTDIRLFVVRSRERSPFVVEFSLDSYEQLMEVDIAAAAAGTPGAGGEVTNEPLFLVCTHGRRDKCCAKFGFPLYRSLREKIGGAVWQSSHIGGDRFAANLVCFPHGLFYAHMTEASSAAIIREYGERRLVLDKYRGRACYANPVQAAEFFIRAESGLAGLDELRFLKRERLSETNWRVQFVETGGGSIHEAQVVSRPSSFQHRITCHAATETSVPQFELESYRVLAGLANTQA
ncbi:MAG: hypothetical protein LC754_18905 [Acidobacteria bacterium]|nr:hypothetical protein [Acidobacteriota bacterium]